MTSVDPAIVTDAVDRGYVQAGQHRASESSNGGRSFETSTAQLLDAVANVLERFIVFTSEHQPTALALWVLHTHVFASFDVTPYVRVSSATKESGKSRLFEVLGLLVARPWSTVGATEATLFRKINKVAPTLLLDETDATFGKDPTLTEGLRGILNAGYCRSGTVSRCVGQSHDVQDFNVYCPKAFAGIGDSLPDTVISRSIPIELKRRSPSERTPGRFRIASVRNEMAPLTNALVEWGEVSQDGLGHLEPTLPAELSDRQQDCWEPLLAIADLAGGDWPRRAREAAVALHVGSTDQDAGVLLLGHIQEAFDELKAEKIETGRLLEHLVNRGDDSPWARWWGEEVELGKTKGPGSRLARMLKPHGIKPKQLWLSGEKTRGYEREQFADTWARYRLDPESNGRTVDRRSAVRTDGVESASDPDSTVLPFEIDGAAPGLPEREPPGTLSQDEEESFEGAGADECEEFF